MHFVDDCFCHKVDRKILFTLRGRHVVKGGGGGVVWETRVRVDLNGPLADVVMVAHLAASAAAAAHAAKLT